MNERLATARKRPVTPTVLPAAPLATQIRREPALDQQEDTEMQAMTPIGPEGGQVSAAVAERIAANRGGGASLDGGTQAQMEGRLGHDFSKVRVHTGTEPNVLNRQLGARAFTVGSDIFFRSGAYEPGSTGGQQLLAHELTHVAQQRTMDTAGPITVGPADDGHERAAAANERAVATEQTPAMGGQGAGAATATESAVGIQRAPEVVNFAPELILSLPPGTTPAMFIGTQLGHVKDSLGLFWDNYRDGLLNFSTSMEFSSEQEAESQYLNAALKGVAKASLDLFLEGLFEGCPELAAPIKMAKEVITSLVEEHERVEKAEGEVKIAQFIIKAMNSIGPAKAGTLDALDKQQRPMQTTYAQLATNKDDPKADVNSAPTGAAAELLKKLEDSQKKVRADVEKQPAPIFQEKFTNSFAVIGSQQVGPINAGNYKNGTLYLTCRMYRDEKGAYSMKEIDSSWMLKTNAPKPERVAGSLDSALKAQNKEPYDAELPKVVRATLEVESGHWYESNDYDDTSYTFDDINEVSFSGADASLHGNDPAEFKAAWDAILKEKVKGVKGLRGSGA
jgi:hypothetical protein